MGTTLLVPKKKLRASAGPVELRTLPLRGYQREASQAVAASVMDRLGLTFTFEIARQGGKNEMAAQLELWLLGRHLARDAEAVKCAPTFRPQLRVSMRRLWSRIEQSSLAPFARMRDQSIELNRARIIFLSADPAANVAGHTASLLLAVDEAQGVDVEKFDREFRPMAASTNATTVMYGTAWDERTLLERTKQQHLEMERKDGIRRHFEFDWQTIAACNPAYGEYVEGERARLGETHPLFLTQYCLKPISGGGRLLSAGQRAQLCGTHERERAPADGAAYVAGLDLAGGEGEEAASATGRGRDATVLTIARLFYPAAEAFVQEPRLEIVEHYAWTGEPHETLLPRLIDLLRTWGATRVAVDATGLGETTARLIAQVLGPSRVAPVKFSARSKSDLGFDLLAAVNGGRLKVYRGDGSAEYREFSRQCELARAVHRADATLNFFVDPAEGHDDYLVSAALLVHASRGSVRRRARGGVREQ